MHVYWEGHLDFKNEEYVVFSLLSGLSFSSLLLFWSICPRGRTPAAQPGAHLSPTSRRAFLKAIFGGEGCREHDFLLIDWW